MATNKNLYISINPVSGTITEHVVTNERKTGQNGRAYVDWKTVSPNYLHISSGNDKVGKVVCFNLPIESTCDHRCECYTTKKCYACSGCYMFTRNQRLYAENYAFYKAHTSEEFTSAFCELLHRYPQIKKCRFFTCGDIADTRFLECMVEIAKNNPDIKFWAYTKKYIICNMYVRKHGESIEKAIPSNLKIIFSHWLNDDGTYFPMMNPYHFPTSEFIPLGMEGKIKVTHVCPCSDPDSLEKCDDCKHPCYELEEGQSMGLQEHSTQRTKTRDKETKKAKEALKKSKKVA